MQYPRVSIILTTYNRPIFLRQAIDSVLNQTYQDLELLIMEDNSDDQEQKEIIFSYWNHPKVWIVKSAIPQNARKDVCRYAHMINHGLKISHGEFIGYICDDDYFVPEKVEKMVRYFDERQDVHVLYGQQRKEYYDENFQKESREEIRPADKILDQAAFNVDHSSVMHRRKVYEDVGDWADGPEYWNAADAEYWNRINSKGYVFHPYNEVLDVHIYHKQSFTNNNWMKL